jgi:hypothetical protein
MDSAGNVSTNSPAFADKANFDYHLTSTSPALNKGIDPGSARGFPLSPQFQYVYNASSVSRTISGSALDAGAYEYNNASVMDRPLRLSSYNSGTMQAGVSPVYDMRGRRLLHSIASAGVYLVKLTTGTLTRADRRSVTPRTL